MFPHVGELIRNQVPDKNGLAMPPDLKTGAYQLFDLADTPPASLYEGKVVTDKQFGHATYGCMICCGYAALQFNPFPVDTGIGGFAALDAEGMDACGGRTLLNLDGYADPHFLDVGQHVCHDHRSKASNRCKRRQLQFRRHADQYHDGQNV